MTQRLSCLQREFVFGDRVGGGEVELGEGGSLFEDVKICGHFRREEDQV
jgi:hypothetical protein